MTSGRYVDGTEVDLFWRAGNKSLCLSAATPVIIYYNGGMNGRRALKSGGGDE